MLLTTDSRKDNAAVTSNISTMLQSLKLTCRAMCALATVVLFSLTTSNASAVPSVLGGAQDPVLVSAMYSNPTHLASIENADGSVGGNYSWENGTSNSWYIEFQRFGGDLIQGGIVNNDTTLTARGWNQLNWGFNLLKYDNTIGAWSFGLANGTGFPNALTSDPFHSASLTEEGAARAVLLMQQAGVPYNTASLTNVENVAQWLINPAIETAGAGHDAPYTHRRWILAAALGMAAAATPNATLKNTLFTHAATFANMGLVAQLPNGVNPEMGGYDVSYQPVGLLDAERYYLVCPDPVMKAAVLNMLVKGLDWQLTKLDSDWNVIVAGSTRVGVEVNRDGTIKIMDNKSLIEALTYGYYITGNTKYEVAAQAVSTNIQWLNYTNMLDTFEGESLSTPYWRFTPGVTMAINGIDRPIAPNGNQSAYAADIFFTGNGTQQNATEDIHGYTWSTSMAGGMGLWLKADLRDANNNPVALAPNQLAIQIRQNQSKVNPVSVDEKWIAYVGNKVNGSTWTNVQVPFRNFVYNGGYLNDGVITFSTLNQFNIEANIPQGYKLTVHVDQIQVNNTIDTSTPVTTAALTGTTTSSGAYLTSAGVTLSATDADGAADIAATYYRVNGAAIQTYTTPVNVTTTGTNSISYWSVDLAGNVEPTHQVVATIVAGAPVTTATLTGHAGYSGYYTTNITVTLTANANGSTITGTYYSVDAGATKTYTGPFIISGDGAHTYKFWSASAAGLIETTHSAGLKVDTQTPVSTGKLAGTLNTDGTYAKTATFSMTAVDTASGIKTPTYSLDNGAAKAFTTAVIVNTLGAHKIVFYTNDMAGNVEAGHTVTFTNK